MLWNINEKTIAFYAVFRGIIDIGIDKRYTHFCIPFPCEQHDLCDACRK